MSEGKEMYEGIESVIEDLIDYYKKDWYCEPGDDYSRGYKDGAIESLEGILRKLNE